MHRFEIVDPSLGEGSFWDEPQERRRELAILGRQIGAELVRRGAFLPALLSVKAVARMLDVVPRVVRRMIAKGTIPATKLGRAYLIPRDAFVRVVERRALAQQPPAARERDGDWS